MPAGTVVSFAPPTATIGNIVTSSSASAPSFTVNTNGPATDLNGKTPTSGDPATVLPNSFDQRRPRRHGGERDRNQPGYNHCSSEQPAVDVGYTCTLDHVVDRSNTCPPCRNGNCAYMASTICFPHPNSGVQYFQQYFQYADFQFGIESAGRRLWDDGKQCDIRPN